MDKIYIRDLALRCIIGVHPEERREKQDVVIRLVLECDHSAAAKSDDLADAVDYEAIQKEVIQLVENSSFNLIESLAERIAQLCLQNPKVEKAIVTVDKPAALRFAKSVAVEVTRGQS